MLGYAVITLFVITALLVYVEKFMGKYKLPTYLILGTVMILLAGLREVGIDPDSEMYENFFNSHYQTGTAESVEFSYLLISNFIQFFSDDVHALFLFYALLGLSLKFIAFRQLSDSWFLPVLIYISYFYIFHEMMQIRTGVLSGLILLSIKPWAEGNKKLAFVYLLIGLFFHYSALIFFPLLFLSNKEITPRKRIIWASLIPAGYLFYFVGLSFLLNISTNLPYIGEKLAFYQASTEKGLLSADVNVFSPLLMFTTFLYFYLLLFHDTIIKYNKYFPLLIKIFALGIFSYTALSIFPVLAQRVNLLMRIVTIILYANISYTIKPKWASYGIIILIAFIYLNYALPCISSKIFWEPEL